MGTQPYIDFRHVREHADFAAILAHYGLKLSGRGRQQKLRCPFHDDRRPSLSIDLEKGVFHCFGCQAKGNALEFVADKEGLDRKGGLREAATKVAAICGIELAPPRAGKGSRTPQNGLQAPKVEVGPPSGSNPSPRAARRVREAPQEPINPPLTFALKLDPEHRYLAERGLEPETIEAFGLGYASRGIMQGRICIPIHDEGGNLVAYAGRWVGPDETIPEGEDKYKLPPGFQKNHVLFNLNRVLGADGTEGGALAHLFIVEGYFSTFRFHAIGPAAVALMGSSMSDEQIALLAQLPYLQQVTLLTDGDEAGRKARESILPRLCARYLVRAPELPEGSSPDNLPDEAFFRLVDDALI